MIIDGSDRMQSVCTVAVKETTCTTEAVMAVEMVVIEEVTMQLSDIVMVIAVV